MKQGSLQPGIVLNVTEPADLVFAVAVVGPLRAQPREVHGDPRRQPRRGSKSSSIGTASRLHRVRSGVGQLVVDYSAIILGDGAPGLARDVDLLTFVRPSRYAESDSLAPDGARPVRRASTTRQELLTAVSSWVGTRLSYVSGSSLPTDGAIRTLLARQGVCRDYSHLCVALLRALGIPARLVAVYAPGLSPMDFHAVAEAWVDGAVARRRRHDARAALDARPHRLGSGCRRHRVPQRHVRPRRPRRGHGQRGRRRASGRRLEHSRPDHLTVSP